MAVCTDGRLPVRGSVVLGGAEGTGVILSVGVAVMTIEGCATVTGGGMTGGKTGAVVTGGVTRAVRTGCGAVMNGAATGAVGDSLVRTDCMI